MDFPYLLWRMMMGKNLRKRTASAGFRWVRMSTDVPAAIHEMVRGHLSLKSYLHSLRSPIEFALMAADDPLPGLLDLPHYVYKHFYNGYQSLRGVSPLRAARLKG
jgi:predicted ATP-grasp superfamily ATP-dependent carboligase